MRAVGGVEVRGELDAGDEAPAGRRREAVLLVLERVGLDDVVLQERAPERRDRAVQLARARRHGDDREGLGEGREGLLVDAGEARGPLLAVERDEHRGDARDVAVAVEELGPVRAAAHALAAGDGRVALALLGRDPGLLLEVAAVHEVLEALVEARLSQ